VTGTVARVGAKPRTSGQRGLPKPAAPRLEITTAGAVGDYNHYRTEQLPQDLDQAILLLTEEVLERLQADGWPVQPGDLGENVTLAGIPESALGPGARLRLGDVILEVSLACDPCTELYVLPYVGPERGPAFLRTLAGRRGWYARVVREGSIEPGTPVELTSPSRTSPDSAGLTR
jgi:MOSC domain-containing protein YiiM